MFERSGRGADDSAARGGPVEVWSAFLPVFLWLQDIAALYLHVRISVF